MSYVFTIKPIDGWRVGDRAYCVRGTLRTKPPLEVGKVYRIASVIDVRGMADQGVTIEGIVVPAPAEGIWGSRFVKLRAGGRALCQIAAHTDPSWLAAYRRTVGQVMRP